MFLPGPETLESGDNVIVSIAPVRLEFLSWPSHTPKQYRERSEVEQHSPASVMRAIGSVFTEPRLSQLVAAEDRGYPLRPPTVGKLPGFECSTTRQKHHENLNESVQKTQK